MTDEIKAALTPRHEAPAEDDDGRMGHGACPYCRASLEGIRAAFIAPAEGAGEDELTLRGLATLINGYARDRDREGLPQTAETLRHAALIIDHYRELRARSSAPEAREVLERIREMDFKAIYGEANYQKLADDLDALYTHPAAPSGDKLRDVLIDLTSWFTKPVQGQNGMVWVIRAGEIGADDALNAALAALKA